MSNEVGGWWTRHMTPKREYFATYRSRLVSSCGSSGSWNYPNEHAFKVSNSKKAVMHNVLHVPKLASNLFSVRAAAKRGNTIKFGQSKRFHRNYPWNGLFDWETISFEV